MIETYNGWAAGQCFIGYGSKKIFVKQKFVWLSARGAEEQTA